MNSLELVPFRVLIDRVTGSVRRHYKRMLLPAAVPRAATASLLGVLQLRWVGALADIEQGNFDPSFFVWWFGLIFVMAFVYGVVFNAIMVAAMDSVSGRPVSMGRAWGFVLHPRVLLTQVSWNSSPQAFTPRYFVDTTNQIEAKHRALRCYEDEFARTGRMWEAFSRSQGTLFGLTAGCEVAEGFEVMKLLY